MLLAIRMPIAFAPPVGSTLFVVTALSGRAIVEITAGNVLVIIAVRYVLLFFPALVLFLLRLARLG